MDAFIIIAVAIAILLLVNKYALKNGYSEKASLLIAYIALALFISAIYAVDYYGAKSEGTVIGSYFEKEEYTASYYVNVFENEKTSKNYRLPAKISRDEEGYMIYYANWPNGGSLNFDDYGWDYRLIVGEKVKIKDDNGKTWFIELTDKKY